MYSFTMVLQFLVISNNLKQIYFIVYIVFGIGLGIIRELYDYNLTILSVILTKLCYNRNLYI